MNPESKNRREKHLKYSSSGKLNTKPKEKKEENLEIKNHSYKIDICREQTNNMHTAHDNKTCNSIFILGKTKPFIL